MTYETVFESLRWSPSPQHEAMCMILNFAKYPLCMYSDIHPHSSVAEYLQSRSWRGLEQQLGEGEVGRAVEGGQELLQHIPMNTSYNIHDFIRCTMSYICGICGYVSYKSILLLQQYNFYYNKNVHHTARIPYIIQNLCQYTKKLNTL